MESLNELKEMIGQLVAFDMNIGVTPIELASNIYEDDYSEVRIFKKLGLIECSVFFYDEDYFSDKKLKYEYRYCYNSDNILQKILQNKNKKTILLWSREEERSKLVHSIFEVAYKLNVDLEESLIEGKCSEALLKIVD